MTDKSLVMLQSSWFAHLCMALGWSLSSDRWGRDHACRICLRGLVLDHLLPLYRHPRRCLGVPDSIGEETLARTRWWVHCRRPLTHPLGWDVGCGRQRFHHCRSSIVNGWRRSCGKGGVSHRYDPGKNTQCNWTIWKSCFMLWQLKICSGGMKNYVNWCRKKNTFGKSVKTGRAKTHRMRSVDDLNDVLDLDAVVIRVKSDGISRILLLRDSRLLDGDHLKNETEFTRHENLLFSQNKQK